MSRYKRVPHKGTVLYKRVPHKGTVLYDIGIMPDGTLHNPRGYPEDIVRSAVLAADARRRARASAAAVKAARTREAKAYAVVARYLAGHPIDPRSSCAICGRDLDGPQSIERGIGRECWRDLMQVVERASTPAPTTPASTSST